MHPLSGMMMPVMTMACIGFAVKENFAPFLMTHPEILDHMLTMDAVQKQHMIEQFDEHELCDRAIHYFSNDEIYLENHKIFYQHPLRKVLYQMQIHLDFLSSSWLQMPSEEEALPAAGHNGYRAVPAIPYIFQKAPE